MPVDAATNLIQHTFNVDREVFLNAKRLDLGNNAQDGTLSAGLQRLLAEAGVSLAAPKSAYYDTTKRRLVVMATRAEVDAIGKVLDKVNSGEPMLHIKARFIEVEPGDQPLPGLDRLIGQITNAVESCPGGSVGGRWRRG